MSVGSSCAADWFRTAVAIESQVLLSPLYCWWLNGDNEAWHIQLLYCNSFLFLNRCRSRLNLLFLFCRMWPYWWMWWDLLSNWQTLMRSVLVLLVLLDPVFFFITRNARQSKCAQNWAEPGDFHFCAGQRAQCVLWSCQWALEDTQCKEQLILLQPTAVHSAAVLLMRTDRC